MDKLQQTIIYRMEGVNYIGSTTNPLIYRTYCHFDKCFNRKDDIGYNRPVYKYVRENMIIIKLIPIKVLFLGNVSRRMVEQYYIDKYDSINNGLNTNRAYRSIQVKQNQYKKGSTIFYNKHKTKIHKKARAKVKCNKCGSVLCRDTLVRHYKSKNVKDYHNN